jgi:hypothetical protein
MRLRLKDDKKKFGFFEKDVYSFKKFRNNFSHLSSEIYQVPASELVRLAETMQRIYKDMNSAKQEVG